MYGYKNKKERCDREVFNECMKVEVVSVGKRDCVEGCGRNGM